MADKSIEFKNAEDFFSDGVKAGKECCGSIDIAFEKLAEEIDDFSYHDVLPNNVTSFINGFKVGFRQNPGDEPDNATRDYNDEAYD